MAYMMRITTSTAETPLGRCASLVCNDRKEHGMSDIKLKYKLIVDYRSRIGHEIPVLRSGMFDFLHYYKAFRKTKKVNDAYVK